MVRRMVDVKNIPINDPVAQQLHRELAEAVAPLIIRIVELRSDVEQLIQHIEANYPRRGVPPN